ncbi:hypothetical protein GPECTOR_19g375 [Gonium pectorale]|uniref:Centrosomal protein of 19 kDa n=1 Tax=Gonium pectorale TaxID=33097 RepID=A0A150GJI5_GONPE|nr:hypothetical protein GPECTOR_19g375 [Gonium pectorale]|eukprot:KXZ49924.1 hypothetical protein GPECTOR_19g375 [Gonium pectorale]
MSRFSTSTASDEAEAEGHHGEDDLLSALDELNKELGGGVGTLTSGLSSGRALHPGVSSELNSRDSSFSARDRPGALPSVGPAAHSVAAPSPAAVVVAAAGGKSRFAAEAEKLSIGLEVTDDLDLNKVTEVELRMAKAAMENDFRKNQLKPGDPGYVYDKQEDFGPPTEDNDWDESDEEEAEPSEEPEVDWEDIHKAVAKPGTAATTAPGKGKPSESPYNSNDWP